MNTYRFIVALGVFALSVECLVGQDVAPPAAQLPDQDTQKQIMDRAQRLQTRLGELRRLGIRDPILADVEVYHKAAEWIVRHGEFYTKQSPTWTLETLDRGLLRATQVARGEAPWLNAVGSTSIRAYRSRVDGSLQPYAVTLPADYGKDQARRWRLDVVLHGRDRTLTEVKFLQTHAGTKLAPAGQDFVQIDIYGRGNVAYRWAGETDVFEAVEHFLAVENGLGRGGLIDPSRLVLRGFSMGGAGTWQLGLHHPGKWRVLGPGAGFTTTHGYIKGLPEKLPAYQEACLSIYDAVDYAENAFNVPIVAYSGSDDAQKAAADNIEARLKALGIPMTHLVAPGLGHAFPPEWRKKVEAEYQKHLTADRPEYPDRVRFVTYTLKYPECFWVTLVALDRHYEKASVDAERTDEGYTVKTSNVRVLTLRLPPGALRLPVAVTLDEQKLEVEPYLDPTGKLSLHLRKDEGKWSPVLPQRIFTDLLRRPAKTLHFTGPIDDAFTSGFLCVRGTGEPWHAATQQYADANLKRFQSEWSKYLRGNLPIKDDHDVTAQDIASRHLILFGDPASNSLIRQVVDALPLSWTREQITLAGKKVAARDHVPVMIYPSPLDAQHYVVLNSGHTFHASDFQGTNALLYPRLGDYALLKLAANNKDPLAVEVIEAGLFDDHWQMAR